MGAGAFKYKHAIVIDDSEMDILLMKIILNSVNYAEKITFFNNADTAIAYFQELDSKSKEDLPDIVLLDINMPEINGFEFLDIINKLPGEATKNLKFIIISSSEDTEDLKQAKKYKNIVKYLVKPIDKNQLV